MRDESSEPAPWQCLGAELEPEVVPEAGQIELDGLGVLG